MFKTIIGHQTGDFGPHTMHMVVSPTLEFVRRCDILILSYHNNQIYVYAQNDILVNARRGKSRQY